MIEAVVVLADAVCDVDNGEASASARIGWFDLRSMWMTDLVEVAILAVIDETIHADRRLEVAAIIEVSGRAYLVETLDWIDDDDGTHSITTVMAADQVG